MKRTPAWAWALIALLAILVFNAVLTPGFFSVEARDGRLYGTLIDILKNAAPVGLLALGMTLVIATGGVDLSVGAIMAIAGALSARTLSKSGDAPTAILGALAAGAGAGLFNGALIAFVELQPIVATLLLMVAGRGLAQLLSDGQVINFTQPTFAALSKGVFLGLPMPIWIALGGLLVIGGLMRQTSLGLFVEATGSNPVAARSIGLNPRLIKLAVYVVSGLCAALAGMILVADLQSADANNLGLNRELDAILAVSVGGTALTGGRFSLVGSLIGALLMQTMETTILTRGVAPEITLILKAGVVVTVCLLQSPVLRERLRGPRVGGAA